MNQIVFVLDFEPDEEKTKENWASLLLLPFYSDV